tara:strand:+ start:171 stop:512 length:342 start_codon:yes stop_codon:yes gene_type:complete
MGWLTKCNNKCKFDKKLVEAHLDLKSNEAICDYCGENIVDITDVAKQTMKNLGFIIKDKHEEAFKFQCKTCNKMKSCIHNGESVVGSGCEKGNCSFSITEEMIGVLKSVRSNK